MILYLDVDSYISTLDEWKMSVSDTNGCITIPLKILDTSKEFTLSKIFIKLLSYQYKASVNLKLYTLPCPSTQIFYAHVF